jgi:hypothetical protein
MSSSTQIPRKILSLPKSHLAKLQSQMPFDIWIYYIAYQQINPFYSAETTLNLEKISHIEAHYESQCKLVIDITDLEKYLEFMGVNLQDFPELNWKETAIWKSYEKDLAEFQETASSSFSYLIELRRFLTTDDITPLLKRVRAELCIFPFTQSEEVSQAHVLGKDFFQDQKFLNIRGTLIYVFSKLLKITDTQILAELIILNFYSEIGMTQIGQSFPLKNGDLKSWSKHPALSVFLLQKTQLNLSPYLLKVILNHHEYAQGGGLPQGIRLASEDLRPHLLRFFDDFCLLYFSLESNESMTALQAWKIVISEEFKGHNPHHPEILQYARSITAHLEKTKN